MAKRNLRIANPMNPLFGICERCNVRFTSFAFNAEEAARQVKAAFDEHECHSRDGAKNNPAPKQTAEGS